MKTRGTPIYGNPHLDTSVAVAASSAPGIKEFDTASLRVFLLDGVRGRGRSLQGIKLRGKMVNGTKIDKNRGKKKLNGKK